MLHCRLWTMRKLIDQLPNVKAELTSGIPVIKWMAESSWNNRCLSIMVAFISQTLSPDENLAFSNPRMGIRIQQI